MKKIIGLSLVFYFLLQINNLSYGQDDRWVYIGSANNLTCYLDKTTVRCGDKDVIVWVKYVCILDCTYSYTLERVEYKVDWGKLYIMSATRYWDNGNNVKLGVSGEWEEIIPDSWGESVLNYVLKWYSCK